jgi:hypothetical protein
MRRSTAPGQTSGMTTPLPEHQSLGGTSPRCVRLRRGRLTLLAASFVVAGLLAAGCSKGGSGPRVANLGSSSGAAGSTSSTSAKGSALAYSQCMRSHGVPAFPDPGSNGDLQVNAGPGTGIDPASASYQAADKTCKSLLPAPVGGRINRAQTLKYSQCMRAHGIKDFPDPNPEGGLEIKAGPGSDLDPASRLFQSAQEACKQYLPEGKGGTMNSTGGGK